MKYKFLQDVHDPLGKVVYPKDKVIEVPKEHSQYMKEVLATGGVKYQILED